MKAVLIMGIVTMFVVMMIPFPVNGDEPENCIEGTVIASDTQNPIVGLEIQCYDEQLDETISDVTDNNGYYYLDLNGFSDCNVGDTVRLIPGLLNAYFVCHPKFVLNSQSTTQYYHFDLQGTPIPHDQGEVYERINIGGEYMWEHRQDNSHIDWANLNNPYYLTTSVTQVTIEGTPCISDSGVYSLPTTGGLEVSYQFHFDWRWHQSNEGPDSGWQEALPEDCDGSYTVTHDDNNNPYNYNAVNFQHKWTAIELLNLNHKLDIRFHMICWSTSDYFTEWESSSTYEQLDFDLGA